MDKFNIKSIILGIGIGVIITCVASMIYFAGTYPAKEPGTPSDSTGIFITDTVKTDSKTK